MNIRRFLQFKLRTAILLMILSGGLLWLNMKDRDQYGWGDFQNGWPVTYKVHHTVLNIEVPPGLELTELRNNNTSPTKNLKDDIKFHNTDEVVDFRGHYLAFNILIATIFIILACNTLEILSDSPRRSLLPFKTTLICITLLALFNIGLNVLRTDDLVNNFSVYGWPYSFYFIYGKSHTESYFDWWGALGNCYLFATEGALCLMLIYFYKARISMSQASQSPKFQSSS